MLSIIVTYYNQEKYVSRSLDSVFNQRLTEDFEVLVGDDGSQDNTCNIVRQYQEKYPGKISLNIQPRDLSKKYNPVERASKNRIDLLNMAKGDYVCFLDGDDEYCDFTWLQESISVLEKNKKLVGVAHNYCEKYPDGTVKNPVGITSQSFISAKLYAKKLYTPAGTILFRNSFNSQEYDKLINLKSFDDNDITFYFLNFGNLYCDNKIVYTYYQNDESIWNSTNEIEKCIINSIDYEIIKKILKKYHFTILIKYFGQVKNVYKNKHLLNEEKYAKYKNQCIKDGIIYKLFNYNTLSFFTKLLLKAQLFFLYVIYIIERINLKFFGV